MPLKDCVSLRCYTMPFLRRSSLCISACLISKRYILTTATLRFTRMNSEEKANPPTNFDGQSKVAHHSHSWPSSPSGLHEGEPVRVSADFAMKEESHRKKEEVGSSCNEEGVLFQTEKGGFQFSSKTFSKEKVIMRLLLAAAGLLFFSVIYYFTTKKYVLTTDPSPYKNTMFFHFPCDYAIVVNRWTRRRRVVSVEESQEKLKDVENGGNWPTETSRNLFNAKPSAQEHSSMRPLTKTVSINCLKDYILCYLQKKYSMVLVEASAELTPDRFMRIKKGPLSASRPNASIVAPDSMPERRPLWDVLLLRRRGWNNRTEILTEAEPSGKIFIIFESVVRPLQTVNGYQKGELPRYEETIKTVTRQILTRRYKDLLLEKFGVRKDDSVSRVHPALAEEMLLQGVVNGKHVCPANIVPDLESFINEVREEVQKRMGDGVIICDFSARMETAASSHCF